MDSWMSLTDGICDVHKTWFTSLKETDLLRFGKKKKYFLRENRFPKTLKDCTCQHLSTLGQHKSVMSARVKRWWSILRENVTMSDEGPRLPSSWPVVAAADAAVLWLVMHPPLTSVPFQGLFVWLGSRMRLEQLCFFSVGIFAASEISLNVSLQLTAFRKWLVNRSGLFFTKEKATDHKSTWYQPI